MIWLQRRLIYQISGLVICRPVTLKWQFELKVLHRCYGINNTHLWRVKICQITVAVGIPVLHGDLVAHKAKANYPNIGS